MSDHYIHMQSAAQHNETGLDIKIKKHPMRRGCFVGMGCGENATY